MTQRVLNKQLVISILFFSLTLVFTVLVGCGGNKEMSETDAKSSILSYLERKYDKSFNVQHVEKEDIGQNFSKKHFFFKVVDQQNQEESFDASMDADGKNPDDNYAKIQYGEEIEEELWGIIKKYEGLIFSEFSPEYILTNERWESSDDYMRSEYFCLRSVVSPLADTEETAIGELYGWMSEMYDKGYGFQIMIHYENKSLSKICDKNHPLETESELLKDWRETDEQ